jgi:hypothetical protein
VPLERELMGFKKKVPVNKTTRKDDLPINHLISAGLCA